MLPGPIIIYQCPKCDNLLYRESLMSGNTFGAKSYSDGKRIAPMLPSFPNLTICSKCNTVFWIKDAIEVGSYEWENDEGINENWKNAQKVRFLTIEEYSETLHTLIPSTLEDLIYISQEIWWGFNDRIRNGEELFSSDSDKELWTENVNSLLELLDLNNVNQKIMIAELYRNMGRFEKCMEVLGSIEIPQLSWLKTKFEKECNDKNTKVFLLN